MKIFTLATSILATTALAAPTALNTRQTIFPKITVSVINDLTGMSSQATVVADGTVFPIPSLFSGSKIDTNGVITASSAQLVQFVDNVFCSFNKGDQIIPINGRNFVFADLDGNKGKATPVGLNEFTFQCQV